MIAWQLTKWVISSAASRKAPSAFGRKPSVIIGTSLGAIGTALAQQNLRSVSCFCNSPLMNMVEAYIQFTPGLITADGKVTHDSTAKFLRDYMAEFHSFIRRVKAVLTADLPVTH